MSRVHVLCKLFGVTQRHELSRMKQFVKVRNTKPKMALLAQGITHEKDVRQSILGQA